jgi:hypothetical protein
MRLEVRKDSTFPPGSGEYRKISARCETAAILSANRQKCYEVFVAPTRRLDEPAQKWLAGTHDFPVNWHTGQDDILLTLLP